MNLDELRAVRDEERASGELQPLRPSFYAEARAFVEEIAAERDRQFEASDSPLSDPAVERLNDKHNSATEVLGSIFENRVSKLLTHAMTVAAGDEADPPEMTAEEAELYRTVVAAITETRAAALDGTEPDLSADPSPEPVDADPSSDAKDPDDPPPPPPDDEPVDDSGVDRLVVRVVDDVGTILGVDEREYELTTGDVVSLPIENAMALVEREVAEPVESD